MCVSAEKAWSVNYTKRRREWGFLRPRRSMRFYFLLHPSNCCARTSPNYQQPRGFSFHSVRRCPWVVISRMRIYFFIIDVHAIMYHIWIGDGHPPCWELCSIVFDTLFFCSMKSSDCHFETEHTHSPTHPQLPLMARTIHHHTQQNVSKPI